VKSISKRNNLLFDSTASSLWKLVFRSSVEKRKMKRRRGNKQPEHKNKLVSFFKRQTRQFVEQQRQFLELAVAPPDQYIALSSGGQPKVNKVKNFLPFLKFMKRPQTKFHAHTIRESQVIRSKKLKIYQ